MDEFPAAQRKRSATPPVKKREPTPDLTDIIPINERKRRMTMWDIKPQGYENVTAEQAKLSGRSHTYLGFILYANIQLRNVPTPRCTKTGPNGSH